MRLCQGADIRPYPYLRWDELGVGSVILGNGETGTPPDSPLVSTAQSDRMDPTNEQRRVQWFPKFMGVRVHLDDSTDLDHSITYATVGDWGATDIEKDAEVRGHDFYYWPYVDGFPGYANWHVTPDETGTPAAYAATLADGRRKQGRMCAACGTRLWGEPVVAARFVVVQPGTLDDTSWLRPVAHIWAQSAQPWVMFPLGAEVFATQPPEFRTLIELWRER